MSETQSNGPAGPDAEIRARQQAVIDNPGEMVMTGKIPGAFIPAKQGMAGLLMAKQPAFIIEAEFKVPAGPKADEQLRALKRGFSKFLQQAQMAFQHWQPSVDDASKWEAEGDDGDQKDDSVPAT